MKGAALVCLACFASAFISKAQFPLTRSIEVRDGQHRPAITCIAQDTLGLLWAGSDRGLFRTDGDRAELILRTSPATVTSVLAYEKGVVAALSSGHVVYCSSLGCDTLLHDSTLNAATVKALAHGVRGDLWLGTYGAGLWQFSKGGVTRFSIGEGLPDAHVNDVLALPDGRVVVATDQGLALCNNEGVLSTFGEEQGAPDNLVLSLTMAPDGAVWAGTDNQGPFRWAPDGTSGPNAYPTGVVATGPVQTLLVEQQRLWVGTPQGPVVRDLGLERGTYRQRSEAPDELHPVFDLLLDHSGMVWWCTGTERVYIGDPAVLVVPEHEGLELDDITALCMDQRKRIWFATPKGLFNHSAAFSDDSRVSAVALPDAGVLPIVSLAAAADGAIWGATFGHGVLRVDSTGAVRRYTVQDGLASDNVLSIRSKGAEVWFATLEGLSCLKEGRFINHPTKGSGFVYDVLPMGDGTAYGATDGSGVVVVPMPGTSSTADGPRTFYTLVQDTQGTVWAAGPGSGICRVGNGKVTCDGKDRAPFDGDLFALAASAGRILAFGSTGTSAYDPTTGQWTDLTARLGLQGLRAELNSVTVGANGSIWLATTQGLTRMELRSAHLDPTIRTLIVATRIGSTVVEHRAGISTGHDRNDLTIQFAGLHYADPSAVRFAYRMVGLNDRILYTGDREVSFTALPPGKYRFEVAAFTGEHEDHAQWVGLDIDVMGPWWQAPWFVGGAVLLAFLVAVLIIRLREKRSAEKAASEQEKVRFQLDALRSQVDPHFLFNSFNTLVELIETAPEKAVGHVEQLSDFFRHILQMRDKELIPVEEELGIVRTYFELERQRFGEAVVLEVFLSPTARTRSIVPLTLQLLVENAIKHNRATIDLPLVITVREEGEFVVISNPIRPRATTPRSTAFGLESITKRYRALHPQPIRIVTEREVFEVWIPLIERP